MPIPEPVAAGELASIAAQLAAAGPAADDVRRPTGAGDRPSERAGGARSARSTRGDVEEAAALTSAARADHGAIVAWETDLPTLPVWIETTDAMIGAVEQILDATQAGDAAAAGEAAAAFAALADDAATADRALRIALSEGGASLTAAPLERLAATLRVIETSRGGRRRRLMSRARIGDVPASPPDPMVGRTLADRYRIDAPVARGGMARVYRARDVRLDRDVAIKVLSQPYAGRSGLHRALPCGGARGGVALAPEPRARLRLGQRR